jgi:hypothetical protein
MPDEAREHHDAIHGTEWRCVCVAVDSLLRDELKYGQKGAAVASALQKVRDFLRDYVTDRGLDLDS